MIILIIFLAALLLFALYKLFKIPMLSNMVLVTGGVKTGKSTMTVWLAWRAYRKQYRKYWISNNIIYPIARLFTKNVKKREKPFFYANIPISCKNFVPLTTSLLRRQKRFAYGSVIYICEASLVADSMTFKDSALNESMLLFNKLIAHETKGGMVFYDTQSIQDCHYAVKRCLSQYFYIHHLIKIPFFCIAYVREMHYSDDSNTTNVFNEDIEDTMKRVIIPKRVWKMFDCYCYSCMTDDLLVVDNVVNVPVKGDHKAREIISFKNYKTIQKFVKEEEKNESKEN